MIFDSLLQTLDSSVAFPQPNIGDGKAKWRYVPGCSQLTQIIYCFQGFFLEPSQGIGTA